MINMLDRPFFITMLEEKIKNVGRKFSNINRGGCGYFAYLFHKEILKQLDGSGMDVTILLASGMSPEGGIDETPESEMYDLQKLKDDHDIENSHVFLELRVSDEEYYYMDCTGIYDKVEDMPWQNTFGLKAYDIGEINHFILWHWITEHADEWNDSFDKNQVPDMAEYIEHQVSLLTSYLEEV